MQLKKAGVRKRLKTDLDQGHVIAVQGLFRGLGHDHDAGAGFDLGHGLWAEFVVHQVAFVFRVVIDQHHQLLVPVIFHPADGTAEWGIAEDHQGAVLKLAEFDVHGLCPHFRQDRGGLRLGGVGQQGGFHA